MNQNRNRLVLLLIFLLFATPVGVAMLMHTSWWPYQPGETVNRGILVEPPRPLDYGTLSWGTDSAPPLGKWVVIYPVSSPCNGACLQNVESLRQIHRSKGRRQDMLAMLPLVAGDAEAVQADMLLEIYPAFLPAIDRQGILTTLLRQVADLDAEGGMIDGQAFLVDPSGNIMMRYAAGFDPGDLNKDLKRLLKWSAQDG